MLCSFSVYALAPVESLTLGNFSEQYTEKDTDPLLYLFQPGINTDPANLSVFQKSLAVYRGFYEEGKNLEKFCKTSSKIEYVTLLERTQMKRSAIATLQYIALDLTSRALAQYAKYFDFSRAEFANMVDGLVGNYCSVNLSVISKKDLKNNLLIKYDKENSFLLPSVKNNPLFPKTLQSAVPERTARENEFKYTAKIFEHACSWGGDPQNAGLLLPFLKDTNIMAFVFRQMASFTIDWDAAKNLTTLVPDQNTQPVFCTGVICRKTTNEKFARQAFHALGGNSVYEDLRHLYCEDIKWLHFSPKENDPRLVKIMNSETLEEEIFLNSQFMSLITGVPDFLLGVEKFNKGDDVFRTVIDQMMNDWAQKSVTNFSKELFFEEPLTLELVDRKQYFDELSPELKLLFDVNLGEFDRINQSVGKVKLSFELNVLKSFLRAYLQSLYDTDLKKPEAREKLTTLFKRQITKDVQSAKEKLILPPWKGDLERIIVNEIDEQLLQKKVSRLQLNGKGYKKILIEINYAPFALKYINFQFNVGQDNKKK
jgi:hypothetical protein